MAFKHTVLLFISACIFSNVLSQQHVDEGLYNDWDFGPHGVYGNLRLTQTTERSYCKIEKVDPQTVRVEHFNPSGIITNTASILFVNGVLNALEETDQWGEKYEYKKFIPLGNNEFKVTDLLWGVNNYLPCKYAKYIYKDELLAEVQEYSFTDKLCENENGVAIVRYKRYDDKIRFAEIKELSFFDAQGSPVISKANDCHTIVNEYDENDNKIFISYLDKDDQPAKVWKSNSTGIRYYYDDHNRIKKLEFYGPGQKITSNIFGISIIEYEYDHGYRVYERRFDSLHVPTRSIAAGDSISVINSSYDNRGNKIKEAYFDETGTPISNHSKVHEVVNIYSSSNMPLQSSFFDEFENPSEDRDKIHTIIYVRDNFGKIIQRAAYNNNGAPVRDFYTLALMIKYKYDEYGRKTAVSYWKDSVTMMRHWNGEFGQTTKFNEDGQPIEYNYFDQNGMPMICRDGSSKVKIIYGADGAISERQFMDRDTFIIRKRGVTKAYSIIKYSHDANNHVNEIAFFNGKYEPVNATVWIKDSTQAHRITFRYKGNRIIEQSYYLVGSDTPSQTIDCLKNDFIGTNGIGTGRKNEDSSPIPTYSFNY